MGGGDMRSPRLSPGVLDDCYADLLDARLSGLGAPATARRLGPVRRSMARVVSLMLSNRSSVLKDSTGTRLNDLGKGVKMELGDGLARGLATGVATRLATGLDGGVA
jgi:hypothetical protein